MQGTEAGELVVQDGEASLKRDVRKDSQMLILVALNTMGKHIYQGTVPKVVRDRRRAKNKRAKQSRKVNR